MADDDVSSSLSLVADDFISGMGDSADAAQEAFDKMAAAADAASETLNGNFSEAVDNAKGKLSELKEESFNVGESIDKMKGSISTIAEVTGIGALIEGFHEVGEAIEAVTERAVEFRNIAEVLGLTTDQTQALSAAADEAGVNMSMVQRSSLRLSETLKEAQEGSGAAAVKLTELGLTLEQASSKSTTLTDVLSVISARLQNANTSQSEFSAMSSVLGARAAIVAEAFKDYDGSADGVAKTMARLNGETTEDIGLLVKLHAGYETLTTQIKNYFGNLMAGYVAAGESVENFEKNLLGIKQDTGADAQTQAAEAAASKQQDLARQTLAAEVAAVGGTVASFKEGTAQRVEIAEQYYNLVKQYDGEGSKEATKAYEEVLKAQQEFNEKSVELSHKASEERIKAEEASSAAYTKYAEDHIRTELKADDEILAAELKKDEAAAKSAEQLALSQIAASQKALDAQLALKQISPQQYDQAEIVIIQAKEAAQVTYYQTLSALRAGDESATVQYAGDIEKVQAEAMTQITAANLKAAQQTQQAWQTVLRPMESAFDNAIQGMVTGTENLRTALKNIMDSIVKDIFGQSINTMVSNWISGEQQKTAATQLWSHMTTALHTTTATTTKAVDSTAATTTIQGNAASAGSGAASAMASIPYVGPALAIAAMAATEAAVLALIGKIASAEGGMIVDQDQLVNVHKDEMILPSHISQGINERILNNPAYNSDGQSGGGDTYHAHINTMDSKSWENHMNDKRTRDTMLKSLKKGFSSSGNRSVR
jgi:hypothetical protein